MLRLIAAIGSSFTLTLVATAVADEAHPNLLSKLRSVTPVVEGLELEVVNRGDELEVANETRRPLLVKGYGGEPYIRFLPDGTVLENQRSPATYLNKDRFATQAVPRFASTEAKPRWKAVARNGTYEWHDHRVHYMGKGTPKQVGDESKRQKVFDWKVEMVLGSEPVVASGTLFWIPTADGGGGPSGAVVALLAALALLLVAAAVLMIRRRPRRPAPARRGAERDEEAW